MIKKSGRGLEGLGTHNTSIDEDSPDLQALLQSDYRVL